MEGIAGPVTGEQHSGERAGPAIAERYIAYVFDDVHLNFGDLVQARDAASKHLSESLQPTLRAAIFSTSGQTMLDFTDDRAKLQAALLSLRPRSRSGTRGTECPDVSYYLADMIQNKHDPQALQAATLEASACMHMDPTQQSSAQNMAQAAAMRALSIGENESRMSLGVLKNVVRRIAGMPGQRSIIVVSPGFITPYLQTEVTQLIENAIHSNITMSALDARGLYVTGVDASRPTYSFEAERIKSQMDREEASAAADVLAEMADGTNGTFYHNNNDLRAGFERVASVPEYSYLLGFSPQNLKLDGSYHKLKIVVNQSAHSSLQSRRGYYAPKHLTDAGEEARREIEEALFSREVLQDIPVELHTQFFKLSEVDAKLAVLARVDVRRLHFRKENGRNRNDLTVVSGLFDRNGNYLQASSKTVEMRLRDGTIENRIVSGITIKTSFDVKAGSYVIRLVVRDAEGQLMAAQNGAIEIP